MISIIIYILIPYNFQLMRKRIMKTKSFIPATVKCKSSKKSTNYWSMLFISLVFLSSIGCFLFANHTNRTQVSHLSGTIDETTIVTTQDAQNYKS